MSRFLLIFFSWSNKEQRQSPALKEKCSLTEPKCTQILQDFCLNLPMGEDSKANMLIKSITPCSQWRKIISQRLITAFFVIFGEIRRWKYQPSFGRYAQLEIMLVFFVQLRFWSLFSRRGASRHRNHRAQATVAETKALHLSMIKITCFPSPSSPRAGEQQV